MVGVEVGGEENDQYRDYLSRLRVNLVPAGGGSYWQVRPTLCIYRVVTVLGH